MRIILVVAGLALITAAASAHHSRAHYTGEMRELEGEVVRVRRGNPHTAVMLETVTDSGEAATWRIDFLGTRGLDRESLEVGQRLRLAGPESVRGPGDLLATNLLLADGNEILLGAVEPFWSSDLERASAPGACGCSRGRCRREPWTVSRMESARRGLESLQPPPA